MNPANGEGGPRRVRTISYSRERELAEDETEPGPRLTAFGAGARIGNYVIEALHKTGGFGVVYRARHATLGRLAALKILHRHLAIEPECVKRFEREAVSVNQIGHPNIVDVFEIGELDDGRPFMMMEWLEGSDLSEELLRRGPLTLAEALEIFVPLLAALGAAHRAGIVHRDVKASNVKLVRDAEGLRVKLLDFGIAKLLGTDGNGKSQLTAEGRLVGSAVCMAPEQINQQPIDARTDVYALGVLLHELLTGAPPFMADTLLELEMLHMTAPPPKASDVAPVPVAVDAVIQRCLEKDPARRYPGVDELLTDLRRAAQGKDPATIGIGVLVIPELADEDPEDEVLDTFDAAITRVRAWLEDQALELVLDGPGALLGAVPLPPSEQDGVALRWHLVRESLALAQELASAEPAMTFSIVLHVGAVGGTLTGSSAAELLAISAWSSGHRPGVSATPDFLGGLDDLVVAEPLPEGAALQRIKG